MPFSPTWSTRPATQQTPAALDGVRAPCDEQLQDCRPLRPRPRPTARRDARCRAIPRGPRTRALVGAALVSRSTWSAAKSRRESAIASVGSLDCPGAREQYVGGACNELGFFDPIGARGARVRLTLPADVAWPSPKPALASRAHTGRPIDHADDAHGLGHAPITPHRATVAIASPRTPWPTTSPAHRPARTPEDDGPLIVSPGCGCPTSAAHGRQRRDARRARAGQAVVYVYR